MKTPVSLLAAAAAMMFVGAAAAATITFDGELLGAKLNNYVVAAHPGVSFSDTLGSDLLLGDLSAVGGSASSLAVLDDDASRLQMDFSSSQTFVSLDFGNDQALFFAGRFFAFLQAFDGATPVGSTLVEANGNDNMDQSIALNVAGGFNRVQFSYMDVNGQPVPLIEVVDNITYESRINQPVPAPATLALVGAALLGLGAARRRKA